MASTWGNLITGAILGAKDRARSRDPQGWGYKPPSQGIAERAVQGGKNPMTGRYGQEYEDWKKGIEQQGYEIGARPYEFDTRAFQDPNYQANKDLFAQNMASRQGVQAPQIGMGNQFRDYQTSLAQQLQQQALGQGDSIAQNQLRQGIEQSIRAQMAAANASNNPMLASRQAAQQAGQMRAGLAGQAALMRLQEQQGAQQLLGGLSEAARGQDIGIEELNLKSKLAEQAMQDEMTRYYTTLGYTNDQAQFQARKELEAMKAQQHAAAQETAVPYNVSSGGGGFNMGGAMGGAGTLLAGLGALFSDIRMKDNIAPVDLNAELGTNKGFDGLRKQMSLVNDMDSMVAAGVNPEFAATEARKMHSTGLFGNRNQNSGFNFFGNNTGFSPFTMAQRRNMLKTFEAGLPDFGGLELTKPEFSVGNLFSDKSLKSNVKQSSQLKDYMNKLKGYTYNYKGDNPNDRWAGVMAQDMEKSKLGKTAVMDVNGFKAIDGKRALSLSLASIAELNKRINKLEGRKGA